jgi:4-amino-4-deoxy-L-arabinose transferase-like glycosyltransferase
VLTRALVLLVVTLIGCWPIWSLPDWDGTEGRRVQIALEMARAGDWMVPMLGGEPTWAKPPLHYWLLGAMRALLGDGQLALRLPAVLGAFLSALLAGELLRRWFGARAGWIGALGIACSPLVLFK